MQRIPRAEICLRIVDTPRRRRHDGDGTSQSEIARTVCRNWSRGKSTDPRQSLRFASKIANRSGNGGFALDVEQIRYRGYDLVSTNQRGIAGRQRMSFGSLNRNARINNRRNPRLHPKPDVTA